MAYFDSPKNYAFWKKELEGLKKMREANAKNGGTQKVEKTDEQMLFRERVTLNELIEEETGKLPTVTLNTPERKRSREMETKIEL